MKHPILTKKGYTLYLMIWAVIIIAHFTILFYGYQIDLKAAILDSLVYNLIFMGLGLGLWYVVYFSRSPRLSVANYAFNHLAAAFITVSLWLFFPKSILNYLAPDDTGYLIFLEQSAIWRGLTGILFYCVIILIYYLIVHYARLQQKVKEESELKSMITEAELDSLKSQINPHFIFNSLNSINALTLTSPQKASDMVVKLSEYLRYSITRGNKEENSLQEELDNIYLYLDIEKVRFGPKLNLNINIKEGCEQAAVPNMILQPLIENAIKHGVNESLESVKVQLTCSLENDYLIINISNNYEPNAAPGDKRSGIGLKNIQKRLDLIYGSEELITIDKRNNIFIVKVAIPQTHGKN